MAFSLRGLYSHLPSLSSAASYVPSLSSATNAIKSWLPKNDHTKKAAELGQVIKSLESSLNEKTGEVFQKKITETTSTIQKEKEKCMKELSRLNGSYYQDPNSHLKKAWDRIVETVQIAIGYKVERAEQIDEVSEKLKVDLNEAKKKAQEKIDQFKWVEGLRNKRQQQLNQILSTEKAAANPEKNLITQKETLLEQHRELCGNYYGDCNGKLDQAWQKQDLASYQQLETQRKQIEAQLYAIDKQLSVPATKDRTYEALTTEAISKQVEELKNIEKKESDLSGVDWSKTLKQAAVTTLVAAGYIMTL